MLKRMEVKNSMKLIITIIKGFEKVRKQIFMREELHRTRNPEKQKKRGVLTTRFSRAACAFF